ncbi:hypothetical protein PW035_57085, partial [Nonomuraea angiospora]|nr:hypothetical protein [Nonomuraea angiospora]
MVVLEAPPVRDTRRVSAAVAAAGVSSFALLYAPQPVLPQLAAGFGLDPGSASLTIGVATGALAVAVLPVAWLAGRVGRPGGTRRRCRAPRTPPWPVLRRRTARPARPA